MKIGEVMAEPYIVKAHEVIARECWEAYRAANILPDGSKRKRYVPYTVPPIARALIDCLNAGDEVGAKALLIRVACGEVCNLSV